MTYYSSTPVWNPYQAHRSDFIVDLNQSIEKYFGLFVVSALLFNGAAIIGTGYMVTKRIRSLYDQFIEDFYVANSQFSVDSESVSRSSDDSEYITREREDDSNSENVEGDSD